jgi:hypothetical protein
MGISSIHSFYSNSVTDGKIIKQPKVTYTVNFKLQVVIKANQAPGTSKNVPTSMNTT